MTAVLDRVPGGISGRLPKRPDWSQQSVLMAIAAVAVPAGCMLIVLGYHHAAKLEQPDNLQFVLFWTGFLIGMLSLAALACAKNTDAVMRTCALAGVGLFGMVPRLQRFGPAGSDEFIHLRQSMEAYYSGDVGHTLFLLPITKEFFGLHQLSSAFARLSGMPLWYAGLSVIALAHVLSVLAVFQLIRLLDVPARGAAVGSIVYTLNPSWLYFHSGFAYESLALPLVLWCLAATVGAGRATGKPALRSTAAALLCVAVLPMIHHLSAMILGLILALLIVVRAGARFLTRRTANPGARERLWPLIVVLLSLLGWIHIWWSNKYQWLLSYLSPAWTEGLSQMGKMFSERADKSSGRRTLFGNTQSPVYEVVSGYLYPFVVLALYLISVTVLWRYRRQVGSAVWAFALLGGMFFASMPMLLTSGGAEGAHRSWGYSFIGIAVMCGLAYSYGQRSGVAVRSPFGSIAKQLGRPTISVLAACIVFIMLAFGSATLGVNLSARFPGAAHVGDDARSVSKEGAAVAEWLAEHAPVDTTVLADRYVSSQVGSLGRMSALRPSATFPIWDLYMSSEPVRPEVLKQIGDADIRYFVVDSRMATTRPRLGYWFTRNEPGVKGDQPFPQVALDRFNCLPWLQAVYAAGPLTVYEVDAELLRSTKAGSCEEPQV